jgi:hypothetical protein
MGIALKDLLEKLRVIDRCGGGKAERAVLMRAPKKHVAGGKTS